MAILHGRKAPDQPSRPAAPGQAREDVVARLAGLACYDTDRVRQHRPGQQLLCRQQALGVKLLAQTLDAGEQITLARDSQVGDGKGEVGG